MNYSQDGVLGDIEPGKRVKSALDRIRGNDNMPDMSQAKNTLPDDVGPKALGRTPAIGSLRRERGMTVIRDQVPELLD